MFVTRQLRRVCRQLQALGNDVAEERFDESLGGKKEEMRSISKKTCQDMHSVFVWARLLTKFRT